MNVRDAEQEADRAHFRAQGFNYCDDEPLPDWQGAEAFLAEIHQVQNNQQDAISSIIEAGVSSSSCDYENQAIGMDMPMETNCVQYILDNLTRTTSSTLDLLIKLAIALTFGCTCTYG